ncbi:MAG: sorbosone dehydrogenase family protein [Pseudomonadota bacterium]
MSARRVLSMLLIAVGLCACGDTAKLPVSAGTGPDPALPPPERPLIPTVKIAPAKGWPDGAAPQSAFDTRVVAFADGLDHPRWLYVLPNGDVLVAETNAPQRPKDEAGLRGWLMTKILERAGAAMPSADRISLLRDTDGDGVADVRTAFLEGLRSPFGMALVGDTFYVANTDAVVGFPYEDGQTRIAAPPTKLVDLPAGPRNHHWTKSLIASPDGSKLYVGVGSNSNVAEHGMEEEEGRAAIWEIDIATASHHVFASGLRNPVGMAWEPHSGLLWVAVNERDELGSDLVPDYMTSVSSGGFYGWPYSYFGRHVDERVKPQQPELVASAIVPDYALGPHTASLGLAWAEPSTLPYPLRRGMFVGQHGSWNRNPPSGYKVIFVPFANGKPSGEPVDVLTGFLGPGGEAYGRPVGVAMAIDGALLVADDVGNVVWRVAAPPGGS